MYNKVKRLAMASDPQSQLSPYIVLGLPENASSGQIHCTYKALIRLVHPDRANRTVNGIGLLKWTKEERESAFGEITKAYRTILEQRKGARDYPDETASDFDLTEFDYEARGFSEEFTVPQEFSAFDLESFNLAFESQNAIDAEHGYSCSLTASPGADDWGEGNDGNFKPSCSLTALALWRGTKLFSETIPSMDLVDNGSSYTTKVPLGGKGGAYALVGSDVRDSYNAQALSLESEAKVEPLSSEEIAKRMEEYAAGPHGGLSPSVVSSEGSCPVLEEAKKIDQNRYREQKKKDEYYRHRKLFIAK